MIGRKGDIELRVVFIAWKISNGMFSNNLLFMVIGIIIMWLMQGCHNMWREELQMGCLLVPWRLAQIFGH